MFVLTTALTAATLAALPGTAAAAPPVVDLCNQTATAGHVACFAERRADVGVSPQVVSDATPSGYGPADLQSAYALPSSTAGLGTRVYVVDAYDDPTAEADLATYRAQYGLPACTTANGCFQKFNQNGAISPLPTGNTGWAGEESLDLDMVSAACPNCSITLIESNDSGLGNMFAAVQNAVALGGKYISMSWGAPEGGYENSYDANYLSAPGVVYTASTGDNGYAGGRSYPATSARVVAVGGTSLRRGSTARGWSEAAWGGAGSGCSADVPQPSWQSGVSTSACGNRAAADVSAVADPSTGVAVYQTYGGGGWLVYGGTSASAPIIASVYAMAATPDASTAPASLLYARPDQLNDVTSGSTGSCAPTALCTATTGWDGPTGLGTPNGVGAFGGPAGPPSTLQVKLSVHSPATPGQSTDVSVTPYLPTGEAVSSVAWKSALSTCTFADPTAQSTTLTCPATVTAPTMVTAAVTDTQGTKKVISSTLKFDTTTRRNLQISVSLAGQSGSAESACTGATTPVVARATDPATGAPVKGLSVYLTRRTGTASAVSAGSALTDATGTGRGTLMTSTDVTLSAYTKAVGVYNAATAPDVSVSASTCPLALTGASATDSTYYADAVTVAGTITRTDLAVPVGNVPLNIAETVNGRSAVLARVTTAADGSYHSTIKPIVSGSLTATVAATRSWSAASADLGALTVLTPDTDITGTLSSGTDVGYSTVATATGTLRRDEGGTSTALYRSSVRLQIVPATGGSAQTIGSANVAADGSWSLSGPVRASGQLRAVYAGSAGQPPATVDLAPVTVGSWTPTVTLGAQYTAQGRGTANKVSGTVTRAYADNSGAAPGLTVRIYLRTGTGDVLLRTAVTSANGGYSTTVYPQQSGSLVARITGLPGYANAESDVAPITVG